MAAKSKAIDKTIASAPWVQRHIRRPGLTFWRLKAKLLTSLTVYTCKELYLVTLCEQTSFLPNTENRHKNTVLMQGLSSSECLRH
jgi:hypothetical protein